MFARATQMAMRCVRHNVAASTRGTLLGASLGLQAAFSPARRRIVCHARGKKNFYTVWEGHSKGVYDNWDAVLQSITNYSNAKYMGFPTEDEAWTAYEEGPEASGYGKGKGKRSSATKFYAVLSGRKPGIYDNWQEARDQVEGCKGSRYRSFNSEDEAREWLDEMSGGLFEGEEDMPKLLPAKPGNKIKPSQTYCMEFYGAGGAKLATSGFSAVLYDLMTYEMCYVNMGTMYKKSTKLQSELTAVIDGLKAAQSLGVQDLLVKVQYTQSMDVLAKKRQLADSSPAKPLSDEALQLLSGFHDVEVVMLGREPVCAVLGEAAQIMRQLADTNPAEFLDVPYKPDLVKQLVEGVNKAPLPLDVAPILQEMVQAYGDPTAKPKAGQPPIVAKMAYVNRA